MRATTAGELTVLAANDRQVTYRVKVENGSGTMIDLTSWVDHLNWDLDIDQPVSGATVYFVRANGATQSLSPLRTDSTLNLKDDLVTISAQLDVGRRLTIEVATTATGAAVVAGDYKLLFSGVIDTVNFEENPVSVSCRDDGGLLVDRWVGANWTVYQAYKIYGTVAGTGTVSSGLGAATFSVSQAGKIANGDTITVAGVEYTISAFSGTTTATLTPGLPTFGASAFTINHRKLEDVMQDILTDAINAGPVPIAVTLNVPTSPAFEITEYKQENQSVMDAMQALAGVIGWDARYKYDSGSGTFKFTLSQPDRTKTTPDYTFGPSAYFKVTRLNVDRTKVRNFIDIRFFNKTSANGRDAYMVGDTTSQNRYGFQYMKIEEPDSSPIDSTSEATSKAQAILSDLKDPKAEQEIELPFFWPAELGDLYRHSNNAVHYNTNQDYAVVRIEHDLGPGHHRTTLKTRGSPAGANVNWFQPPTPQPLPYIPRLISPSGVNLLDASGQVTTADLTVLGVSIQANSVGPGQTNARFRCKIYKSANQTITNGTQPVLTWDSEDFDVGGLHSTSVNTSRITIPTGGDVGAWWITAQVKWITNAASYRIIRLLENGVVLAQNIIKPTGLVDEAMSVFAVVNAPTAGNYYEVDVSQATGGNLDVIGGTVYSTFFSAVHIW